MSDNNDYDNLYIDDMIIYVFDTITSCKVIGVSNPEDDVDALCEVFDEKMWDVSVDINTHYYYKPTSLDDNYDNFLKTAIIYLRPEIVELLINYGININIPDSEGLTPLDILYKNLDEVNNGEFDDEFTEYGWDAFYAIESMLLNNGAMTREQIIIRMQRLWRINRKYKIAKRNLAYSKSFMNHTLNRKPEKLSELASDLLDKIRTYMID